MIILRALKDAFLSLLICSSLLAFKKNPDERILLLGFLIVFILMGIDIF